MAGKTSGHYLNFGSEHEFQHPEGVNTSLALHNGGLRAVAMATRRTTIQMDFDIFIEIENLIIIFEFSEQFIPDFSIIEGIKMFSQKI